MGRRFVLVLAVGAVGLTVAGVALLGGRPSLCRPLAIARLERIAPGCAPFTAARLALAHGHAALAGHDFTSALEHFRTAATRAPMRADAHLARGEAAEALGEFDEAVQAYEAAVQLSGSATANLRFGVIADRLGRAGHAVTALEQAQPWWPVHALHALRAAALHGAVCVAAHRSNVPLLLRECVPGAAGMGRSAFRASREAIPQYVFAILVEAGRWGDALWLAHRRGWIRNGADYCEAQDLPVSPETAGLLAMLVQPRRADCVLALGMTAGDDGAVRLARVMLLDRALRSTRAEVREQAAWYLRYRLPAHEVPKIAESLNIAGWRLHHRFGRPLEALRAYQKAIAADPAFSWPYHNVGEIFLAQKDDAHALAWLERAVAVNPDHWRAQFGVGVAAHRLAQYDKALAAYRRALEMNPLDADGHANVGWLLLRAGRVADGLRELEMAVRLNPELDRERSYLDTRVSREAGPRETPRALRGSGTGGS